MIERKASAIVAAMVVAGCGSSGAAVAQQSSIEKGQLPERYVVRGPAPLGGVPLTTDSRLNLLVASRPPFVFDVDKERTTPLPGVSSSGHEVVWTVGIGGRAAVVGVGGIADMDTRLYGVRNRGLAVSDLGTGNVVWSSNDGRAAWVQRRVAEPGCTLHKVGLEGQVLRAPRAFPCARAYDPNVGALGLVVNGTRIIDPNTGREVLKVPLDIIAGTGDRLVLGRWGRRDTQLTLLDVATRAQRRIPWPSMLASLDRPAVDPKGRFIALAFADPAWKGGAQQALDVWLLDTRTQKLTQLPSMPALVSLKFTSIAWTADRRLVLLAKERGGKEIVAVWRPGQQYLAIKTVRLPEGTRSGSFAVLE